MGSLAVTSACHAGLVLMLSSSRQSRLDEGRSTHRTCGASGIACGLDDVDRWARATRV